MPLSSRSHRTITALLPHYYRTIRAGEVCGLDSLDVLSRQRFERFFHGASAIGDITKQQFLLNATEVHRGRVHNG